MADMSSLIEPPWCLTDSAARYVTGSDTCNALEALVGGAVVLETPQQPVIFAVTGCGFRKKNGRNVVQIVLLGAICKNGTMCGIFKVRPRSKPPKHDFIILEFSSVLLEYHHTFGLNILNESLVSQWQRDAGLFFQSQWDLLQASSGGIKNKRKRKTAPQSLTSRLNASSSSENDDPNDGQLPIPSAPSTPGDGEKNSRKKEEQGAESQLRNEQNAERVLTRQTRSRVRTVNEEGMVKGMPVDAKKKEDEQELSDSKKKKQQRQIEKEKKNREKQKKKLQDQKEAKRKLAQQEKQKALEAKKKERLKAREQEKKEEEAKKEQEKKQKLRDAKLQAAREQKKKDEEAKKEQEQKQKEEIKRQEKLREAKEQSKPKKGDTESPREKRLKDRTRKVASDSMKSERKVKKHKSGKDSLPSTKWDVPNRAEDFRPLSRVDIQRLSPVSKRLYHSWVKAREALTPALPAQSYKKITKQSITQEGNIYKNFFTLC
jgi:hypothetical protein